MAAGTGAPDHHATEDFDAFWAEQNRQGVRLDNVFGMTVELPPQLPLRFQVQAQQVEGSEELDDVQGLVEILFGRDVVEQGIERGMDVEQFGVLLLWGSSNAVGQRMTLAEARDEYARQDAEQGKAQAPANREDRRAASRAKAGGSSSSTGRRSNATSTRSTGSARKS